MKQNLKSFTKQLYHNLPKIFSYIIKDISKVILLDAFTIPFFILVFYYFFSKLSKESLLSFNSILSISILFIYLYILVDGILNFLINYIFNKDGRFFCWMIKDLYKCAKYNLKYVILSFLLYYLISIIKLINRNEIYYNGGLIIKFSSLVSLSLLLSFRSLKKWIFNTQENNSLEKIKFLNTLILGCLSLIVTIISTIFGILYSLN